MSNRPFSRPGGDISHRMGLWKTRRPVENERFIIAKAIIAYLANLRQRPYSVGNPEVVGWTR